MNVPEMRAQVRGIQAAYERLARARPGDSEALHALALQLVLWADGRRGDLARAERLIHRALTLAPDTAELHALAGRIHDDLGRLAPAAACFRRAVELRPDDRDYANYLLHLLARSDDLVEFERLLPAVARRHGVDLGATRRALRREGMPVDARTVYLNAFPAAYNYLTSRLWDEAGALEKRRLPARHRRAAQAELKRALASRRANRVRRDRLPAELRTLAPLARKWGVGDDADRGLLLSRMTAAERRTLRRMMPVAVRRRVNGWLEGFQAAGRMPSEAAAFMYLLEAYEELPRVRRTRPAE